MAPAGTAPRQGGEAPLSSSRRETKNRKKPSDTAVGREVCGDAAPDSSFGQ